MTAREMLHIALKILGYYALNNNQQLVKRVTNNAIVFENLVYSDLWRLCKTGEFVPIETLQDEIDLPEKAINDVFPYGLAMFIAQSESDGDQQQTWAFIYNQKRASLSKIDSVTDVIPR